MSRNGVEVARLEDGRLRVVVDGREQVLRLEQADELAAAIRSETFLLRREIEKRNKGRR
jgi:hypothetical protein